MVGFSPQDPWFSSEVLNCACHLMPSCLRKFCTDPMFSSIIFSPLGPQNRPETVPRLPGYKIDTFLKVFNEKSMVFRSPAAPDPTRRSKLMLF